LTDRLVSNSQRRLVQRKYKRFRGSLPLAFLLTILVGCGGSGGGDSNTSSSFPRGTGTATLSWAPPTANTDGSPVNLTGFNIYVGTSQNNLQRYLMVSAIDTTTVISGLGPGTYFFAITAVSSTGAESALSNIASKTIT
jgi:hypothetical protein